jgi:uncharacterized membrane protein YagU involved in acid resistance
MNTKIKQAVLGGIAGSAVMTMIMFIAPLMRMPKMNPAEMLAGMMGIHIVLGWMMHFMIGITFAVGYVFLVSDWLRKIESKILKGAIFGFAVFIFAQIMMAMMSAVMGGMPSNEGSMMLMMIGSIMGHIIYGIVMALFVKKSYEYQPA